MQFPDGFLWGVATSSFQVEGALDVDGRSPSIWDEYMRTSPAVRTKHTGAIACDSYHRWQDDLNCLDELGVGAYRFSICWPRVMPDGVGPLNPKGIAYYDRLIDGLLERGIQPFVTLYHWDMPQCLEDRGGWQSREMADWYCEYAVKMVEAFGNRVVSWTPFNEMHAFVSQGYGDVSKAPGLALGKQEVAQIYHHVLLAQGRAVAAMRAVRPGLFFGTGENPRPPVPVIDTEANRAAAGLAWEHQVGFLFEPAFHGRYPANLECFPDVHEGDMDEIHCTPDFIGLNFYNGIYVEAEDSERGYRTLPFPPAQFKAEGLGWLLMVPEAAYWGVRLASEKYAVDAVYVTENGFPIPDNCPEALQTEYVTRLTFVRAYLSSLHRALSEGYPLRGYFYWTLVDSLEWINGFDSRFGLYRLDLETRNRIPRLSARWYSEVARTNRIV